MKGSQISNMRIIPAIVCLAAGAVASAASAPPILTEDVDEFYRIYDASDGHPSAAALQTGYIDAGSAGLHLFAKQRNLTGKTMAAAIAKRPAIFAEARHCAALLPATRKRVGIALEKLGELYPKAISPPVTILIGRGNTGGTAGNAGVMIGLETICAADYLQADLEDRMVHLIAHEYVHVQQPLAQIEDPKISLLMASLVEGGAEFIAELTSGSVSNRHLQSWTDGREKEIEAAFLEDADKVALDTDWLYRGPGTRDAPGDLGYWVGYRIAKSYYRHADDKQAAIHDIIEVRDADAFLAKSGWVPGIELN